MAYQRPATATQLNDSLSFSPPPFLAALMPPKQTQGRNGFASAKENSAASAVNPGNPQSQDDKGILWGKSEKDLDRLHVDIFDPAVDFKFLFGDLRGAVLLDEIYRWYGDGEYDIPWFDLQNKRTIIRSPLSREIQEATCMSYKARILQEGLSQMASGSIVCRWLDQAKSYPAEAGTFNHRAEALYRAASEAPDNQLVMDVVKKGLQKVRVMTLVTVRRSAARFCYVMLFCCLLELLEF